MRHRQVNAANGGTIEVPVLDIDLYQPELLDDPWPVLREIREAGPLVWNERGFWMTARDRVCRHILSHAREMRQADTTAAFFGEEAFVAVDDKQRHNELRNIWISVFGAGSVARLALLARATANRMIDDFEDELRAGEAVDVMGRLCRQLPTVVIAHLMGVSADMIPEVVRWSDVMADQTRNGFPIDYDNDPYWIAGEEAKQDLSAYLLEQIEYRRGHPSEDLVSMIVARERDLALTKEVMLDNVRQILFGGNETTAKWLGNVFATFARFHDVRRELVADRNLIGQAAEEVMRWQVVTQLTLRNAAGEATSLEGVLIEPEHEVQMLIGGACRDPDRWEDPERFDIHRVPKPHLGFGFGMHSCIGAVLARMEVRETLSVFLDRFPEIHLARPVVYGNFSLRGPAELYIAEGAG